MAFAPPIRLSVTNASSLVTASNAARSCCIRPDFGSLKTCVRFSSAAIWFSIATNWPQSLTGTTWAAEKEKWADLVLEDLFTYAPNLREHILDRVIITPDDLHNEYLITDGNIFHGSMMLDQLFGARPIPELANYRTPVRNYYLCGSGTHPGGGVMGANGHNAAKAALADTDGVVSAAPLRSAGTRAPWQQRMVGTLMGTRPGRWFGYQAARQPALRKITAYAARVR